MILFILSIIFGVLAVVAFVMLRSVKDVKSGALIGIPFGIGVIALALFLWDCSSHVANGRVGLVSTFGSVSNDVLEPGLHFINPFSHIVEIDMQTDEIKEEMEVPTKEGLAVGLEASVIYHVNSASAVRLYKTVGPKEQYEGTIIAPLFRSAARGITSEYDAKALYTGAREALQTQIQQMMQGALAARGITLESVLLRKVTLPQQVQASISSKVSAEQDAQKMEFVLQKEKQEAERKRIEAQGIADFQKTVSTGISEPLLKWKGIEATEKLAGSSNTKIVVIGGKDGMPLILND